MTRALLLWVAWTTAGCLDSAGTGETDGGHIEIDGGGDPVDSGLHPMMDSGPPEVDGGPPADAGVPVTGEVCPGWVPWTEPIRPCRVEADCPPAEDLCLGAGEVLTCGPCRMPRVPCTPSDACTMPDGTAGVCFEFEDRCACGPGISTRCESRCATDADCTFNHRCAPEEPGIDDHGCVRRSCTTDEDCDCGSCVDDLCWDGPGACRYVTA